MIEQQELGSVAGRDVYGRDGEKIGSVAQVYQDDRTGQPEWLTVHTGLFGLNESFVPLREATVTGDRVEVPYDKSTIKDAPNVAADGHLEPEDERRLYEHYSLDWDTDWDRSRDTDRAFDLAGHDSASDGDETSGPNTDDAMTRSEEQVRVGTQTQESGQARLRKYVVTENVTETVPVRKEKAVLETEPVTSENYDAATSRSDISEDLHEVTLHEERPVVEKTTQPVERVRLTTEEETDHETVSEEVRKEQVEAEGDISTRR
jgi:stress response protein YsnF